MGYLTTVEVISILLTIYTLFLVLAFTFWEVHKNRKREFEYEALKALMEKICLDLEICKNSTKHIEKLENIDAKTSQILNESDIVRLFREYKKEL